MNFSFLHDPLVEFPPTTHALNTPNGLLAIGGSLDPEILLTAYSRGIFPWFSEGEDVHWWSPSPRMVLFPEEAHCSRSLSKKIRKVAWSVKVNSRFDEVINQCAKVRENSGTWITASMQNAYCALHEQGFAHSFEVYDKSATLIGGLYGVSLGRVFFGESMFTHSTDASKVAFLVMARWLLRRGFPLIDCQVSNPHLESLGAREINRSDFESILSSAINSEAIIEEISAWRAATNKVLSMDGYLLD